MLVMQMPPIAQVGTTSMQVKVGPSLRHGDTTGLRVAVKKTTALPLERAPQKTDWVEPLTIVLKELPQDLLTRAS